MAIKITKTYGELLATGNFCNCRVEVTLSSSTECTTPEEVHATSDKLIKMAKILVRKDIEELKIEKGIKN